MNPDIMTITIIDENLRCLEAGPNCEGEIEFRDLGRDTRYARCDRHFRERLELQERLASEYPDSPHAPAWFDPSAAGERWDDDY